VLRESLLVVRGGIFEFDLPSFVFAASCIAMVFCSFLSKQKEMVLFFGFSRYPPTYMMREGQVAGSSCPFSFLCLYLIIRIRLRCRSPVIVTTFFLAARVTTTRFWLDLVVRHKFTQLHKTAGKGVSPSSRQDADTSTEDAITQSSQYLGLITKVSPKSSITYPKSQTPRPPKHLRPT
jgi:hypothetical protein